MTNHKPSFASVPSPLRDTIKDIKAGNARDAGEELEDTKLQGVKVTEAELTALLKDLGLGGADADELASGLVSKDVKEEDEDVASEKHEDDNGAKGLQDGEQDETETSLKASAKKSSALDGTD